MELKKKRYSRDPKRSRIYNIWTMMRYRCISPKCAAYKYYGARGISVCEEWQVFENFYRWSINNGYEQSLTIDRINSDGNYEPNNCRWVDYFVQARNRRKREKHSGGKHRRVVQLTKNNEYIKTFYSITEARKSINASDHKNIILCCQHKQKTAYGYKWMYAEEYEEE